MAHDNLAQMDSFNLAKTNGIQSRSQRLVRPIDSYESLFLIYLAFVRLHISTQNCLTKMEKSPFNSYETLLSPHDTFGGVKSVARLSILVRRSHKWQHRPVITVRRSTNDFWIISCGLLNTVVRKE